MCVKKCTLCAFYFGAGVPQGTGVYKRLPRLGLEVSLNSVANFENLKPSMKIDGFFVGTITGSSNFLDDLKEVLSFKNEYYPNLNQNCSLAI